MEFIGRVTVCALHLTPNPVMSPELLNFLSGKKTYLACIAIFALLFGTWQGWWKIPDEVYTALIAAGLMFLRLGVSKIQSNQPAPPPSNSTPPTHLLCFLCFLLLNSGCSSPPIYSPLPPPSPWTNGIPSLPPIPQSAPQSKIEIQNSKISPPSYFIAFSNIDRGPLFFHIESSTDLRSWTPFTNGVAFPGETKLTITTAEARRFYRIGWPVNP